MYRHFFKLSRRTIKNRPFVSTSLDVTTIVRDCLLAVPHRRPIDREIAIDKSSFQ